MYKIFRTDSFKKDYKKLSMQDREIVKKVIAILANGEELTISTLLIIVIKISN